MSYIVDYCKANSTSASKAEHILVVGSETGLTIHNDKYAIVGDAETTHLDSPNNLVKDVNSVETPFINLAKLEIEINGVSNKLKDEGFSRAKSIKTKDVVDFLISIPELRKEATRLYHYYKYFSQYEHFSENGQADVLASSEKAGNDNIHLPSAIIALSAGVEIVMNNHGKQ